MYQQTLDPIGGSLGWSAAIAAIPLLAMFAMLGLLRWKAHRSALIALVIAIVIALVGWGMPVQQTLAATGYGALYGLFPILWILINALFVYRLTVVTGYSEILGRVIRSVSDDQRILSIVIAFCFGALLESLAGFGAPVAISAAMLLAAGMKPLKAATVSLLANTAPVAFGAMGAPIIALAGVTHLPLDDLAAMAGRQTPFLAAVVPLVMVYLVDGKRGVRETWPVAVVAGVVFGVSQFFTSNFLTVELTDVVAAIVTLGAVLLMLKVWTPKRVLAAATTGGSGGGVGMSTTRSRPVASRLGEAWRAIAPYLIIIAIFSIAQIPVGEALARRHRHHDLPLARPRRRRPRRPAAERHELQARPPQGHRHAAAARGSDHRGAVPDQRAATCSPPTGETLVQLRFTIVTVTAVLALAFVMNLSGQTAEPRHGPRVDGRASSSFLSPVIGWIGVAITGSDTSSNSLFGAMQVKAATEAGLNPLLMAAANSSAGVLGKMLSPQNLAVAVAAISLAG